jgi:hypothetical protein
VDSRKVHYGFAFASFGIAFFTYVSTMQPTIPFWDCGEFAAAAWALQVPHPPGAPLWSIIGRLGMLIPTFADPVARYNLLSVISSAFSIMLLYLTIVRLIKLWRGMPKTTADMLIHYGGAFVGALAYCFTDSFWFNALECEVYAFGSLFISLVPWLILVWYDHADEPHSEKYLMLIAYVIGLSLGVHQLALLTLFPVWMLVYYKRWKKTTISGWFIMVLTSLVAFAFIFLLVLTKLVDWAGHGKGAISAVVLIAMIGSLIYSQIKKVAWLNLAMWGAILILFGYGTYAFVMVRAAQEPPMDQQHPSTFASIYGYIARDQYGDWKMLPRRLEDQNYDHSHDATFNNYSSDWDFFWRYQTNFMFHRYLGWNFIGRDGDDQGAGVDFSKTWAIPLILGVFGMFWHFRRDPKRALTLLGTFIIMGYLVDWYQNQQDPQPRERDYFYVGACYVLAMWIGIGAVGIFEFLRHQFGKKDAPDQEILGDNNDKLPIVKGEGPNGLLAGAFVVLLVLVPLNLCVGVAGLATGHSFAKSSKWSEYSRYHNYVPWDYAYNILQSCEKDAILFTYGDNDTFPLWCLQDVYGIRRDIRIVQLSLANLPYYMKLLKHSQPWGAKTLNLPTFSDEVLNLPDQEAEEGLYRLAKDEDVTIDVPQDAARWIMGDSSATAATMHWKATPHGIPAEELIIDIVKNHIKDRPIYFSSTVSDQSFVGLGPFLVHEGLASRVTPYEHQTDNSGFGGAVNEPRIVKTAFTIPLTPQHDADRGMILRSYNDPSAHRSAMDDQYSMTYRVMYLQLANYFLSVGNLAGANRALDTLESRVPPSLVHLEYPYASIIQEAYERAGNEKKSKEYAKMTADRIREVMQDPNWRDNDRYAHSMRVDYTFADMLLKAGEYDSARAQFLILKAAAPQNQAIYYELKAAEVDARKLEAEGKKQEAYQKYNDVLSQFVQAGGNPSHDMPDVIARRDALAKVLGVTPPLLERHVDSAQAITKKPDSSHAAAH